MVWVSFSTSFKSLLNAGSTVISFTRQGQEMMPSSEASVRIDDVRAISMASWVVSFPVRELCEQHEEDRCRDMESAAVFDFPGRCVILKRHGRVRCFRRKSREFVISSNARSPKIFVKGLWSVTMTRLSQPCVKYFVCSRPQPQPELHFR